jgi:hypothetical protein
MTPSDIQIDKSYASTSGKIRRVTSITEEKDPGRRKVRYTTPQNGAGGACGLLKFARWASKRVTVGGGSTATSKRAWLLYRNTQRQTHDKIEEAMAATHKLPIVVHLPGAVTQTIVEDIARFYQENGLGWKVTIKRTRRGTEKYWTLALK